MAQSVGLLGKLQAEREIAGLLNQGNMGATTGLNRPTNLPQQNIQTPHPLYKHTSSPSVVNSWWRDVSSDFRNQHPLFGGFADLILRPTLYTQMRQAQGLPDDGAVFNREQWEWQ